MDRLLRLGQPLLQLCQPLMSPVHEPLGIALELSKPVLQSRHRLAERHINGQQGLIKVRNCSTNMGLETVVHCLDVAPHCAHAVAQRFHVCLILVEALLVSLACGNDVVQLAINQLHVLHESCDGL